MSLISLAGEIAQRVAQQQQQMGTVPTHVQTSMGTVPLVPRLTTQSPQGGLVTQPTTSGTSAAQLAGAFSPTSMSSLRSSLGAAPTVEAPPSVADAFKAYAPTATPNMSDDFYNNQRQMLMNQLNDEFFGPTGTMHQVASQESAGGRLGSGVGNLHISEGVLKPYSLAQEQGNLGIMNAQIQEQQANRQFNADQQNKYAATMATMLAADSTNALTARQATAQLAGQYQDLLGRMADAESGRLSQQQIAQLDADVRMYEAAAKARAMEAQTAVDKANAQINYMNSLGQFKPVEGGTAAGASNSLANYFGVQPSSTASTGSPAGAPQTEGYDGQISNDGKYVWRSINRAWVPRISTR